MHQHTQANNYDALIKSIRRKRKAVTTVTLIIFLFIVLFGMGAHLEILDVTLLDWKGMHPVVVVLLAFLIGFLGLMAYALVSTPLEAALNTECDPEKYLILNDILSTQKNKDDIYAVAFTYMGNFEAALRYADNIAASDKPAMALAGLFNKARCEFFLGDYVALKATVAQYENALNHLQTQKRGKIKTVVAEKMQKTLALLVAIVDGDQDNIAALSDVEAWNLSKATQGYIHYLKGMAAHYLSDTHEAVYHFMYVKKECEKTVFAQLSAQYLTQINSDK